MHLVSVSIAGRSVHLQPAFHAHAAFANSFLVADRVYVASVPAKTHKNTETAQYVFSSTAEENDFAIYPDPRGRTLERGTEITLVLKPDAFEYLDNTAIAKLMYEVFVLVSL